MTDDIHCCDLHRQYPQWRGLANCANLTVSVSIPIPTHDEHAGDLFSRGFISQACRVTPCEPCDGRAAAHGVYCICGCHSRKG